MPQSTCNMTGSIRQHLQIKAGLVFALVTLVEPARATQIVFSWSVSDILAAYDTSADLPPEDPDGFNYGAQQVGLTSLLIQIDDPAAAAPFTMRAPTFSSQVVWSGAQTNTPPPPSVLGPWARLAAIPGNTFVYLTAYTGPVFWLDPNSESPDPYIAGFRFPASAVFSIAYDVSPADALRLTQISSTFFFRAQGEPLNCVTDVDVVPCTHPGALAAYADPNKPFPDMSFVMGGRADILTPEPSTWMMVAGALAVAGVRQVGKS
jgi:hypothetical protein